MEWLCCSCERTEFVLFAPLGPTLVEFLDDDLLAELEKDLLSSTGGVDRPWAMIADMVEATSNVDISQWYVRGIYDKKDVVEEELMWGWAQLNPKAVSPLLLLKR